MKNVGIFGGSFNPPHLGHLVAAETVQNSLKFNKILFIPSAATPNKSMAGLAAADDRLAMTRLAVQGNLAFEVSDIEIRRPGPSYTIDTLRLLLREHPGTSYSLIIGMDNFLEFETWKEPQEILDMADLLVMNRPGFLKKPVSHQWGRRVRFIDMPDIAISSRTIRLAVRSGASVRYLVPRNVEEYIVSHTLYKAR
jgi:nicotinate-nucleotide adenylyltransferase